MRPLSDDIEEFIKSLLQDDQDQVDVQRNELAGYFRCAPSQITYVLSTRFTPDRGYVIESRRGGGGYVRIVRLKPSREDHLFFLINERIGAALPVQDACAIIRQLAEQGVISERESELMLSATSARAINLPLAVKDTLRAGILREMLLTIAKAKKEA
ncbi:hypothetical protein FACS18948_3230 [Clostridia bacterium]|nr:hypothetical protein FACS18948_3230 [Clostridia bacterium]